MINPINDEESDSNKGLSQDHILISFDYFNNLIVIDNNKRFITESPTPGVNDQSIANDDDSYINLNKSMNLKYNSVLSLDSNFCLVFI